MYDIHCHIISGVDDGAKDVSDSLEMAKILGSMGFNTIVATPHYIDKESEVSPSQIFSGIYLLNQELKNEGVHVMVLPGMEVFITPDIVELYEQGKIITLNCKNYMLIELPLYNSFPMYIEEVLFNLEVKGVKPIIAHPERYRAIIDDMKAAYGLIRRGCLFQVNLGSLEGKFGKTVQKTAYELMKNNIVHAIATDSHSSSGRIVQLSKSYSHLVKEFGKDIIDDLTINNPKKIIDGEEIYVEEPVIVRKKRFWIF